MPAKAAASRQTADARTDAATRHRRPCGFQPLDRVVAKDIAGAAAAPAGSAFRYAPWIALPVIQINCSCRTTCPPVKSFMRVTSAISTSPRFTHPAKGVESEQFSSS